MDPATRTASSCSGCSWKTWERIRRFAWEILRSGGKQCGDLADSQVFLVPQCMNITMPRNRQISALTDAVSCATAAQHGYRDGAKDARFWA